MFLSNEIITNFERINILLQVFWFLIFIKSIVSSPMSHWNICTFLFFCLGEIYISKLPVIQQATIQNSDLTNKSFKENWLFFIKLLKNKFVMCICSPAMHYFFKPSLAALLFILPDTGASTLEFVIMLHYMYPESFICQHTLSPPRRTPTQELKWEHTVLIL
jgi:hypothetical protein